MSGIDKNVRRQRLGRMRCVSTAALALGLSWAGAANAQDEAPTPETAQAAAPAAAQDIIVTGSRLARSTFDTPTPVTVMGGQDFQRLAITNVGQGIAELPAFRPSTSPTTQGFGSFNVGANIVNLRGLGVTRNLILVDGRRFAPTTATGLGEVKPVARRDPVTMMSLVPAAASAGADA